MSLSDTTVPTIIEEQVLRCCGERMFWNHTESKPACPGCGSLTNWRHWAKDNWDRDSCLVAIFWIIDTTGAFMAAVDDVFPEGTIINLVNDDEGLAYRVVAAKEQDDLIHYTVEYAGPMADDKPVYELDWCSNPRFPSYR